MRNGMGWGNGVGCIYHMIIITIRVDRLGWMIRLQLIRVNRVGPISACTEGLC
jgi:hypothetical protein